VTDAVLVDTNVFSARLREHSPLASTYAKHLFGQRIAVAPQTLAEVKYGALKAGWGPTRVEAVERLTGRV
jgi:predicted nucleic acid-binding protein